MLLLGPPGYACPIYSRTGKVTEGGEATALHMFCKLPTLPLERSLQPLHNGGFFHPFGGL